MNEAEQAFRYTEERWWRNVHKCARLCRPSRGVRGCEWTKVYFVFVRRGHGCFQISLIAICISKQVCGNVGASLWACLHCRLPLIITFRLQRDPLEKGLILLGGGVGGWENSFWWFLFCSSLRRYRRIFPLWTARISSVSLTHKVTVLRDR